MNRTIIFWPDGAWCDKEDQHLYTHRSDDVGSFEVHWETSEAAIDRMALAAANGEAL